MAEPRPRVVYWFIQPTPYAVARFNAVADSGALDFEAWFSEVRQSDRSWDVDESQWRFPARYIPARRFLALRLRIPLPELAQTRPDVFVLENDRINLAIGAVAGRAFARRLTFRILPNFDAWSHRTWWREASKHLLFRAADGVKVPGPDGKARAVRYGTEPHRASVVRQSIDLDLYGSAREVSSSERAERRRMLGLSGCVFLYVGRLWKGKGLDELFTAYRSLEAELGDKVSLLVVGDGVDESHYRALFSALPRVVMAGFVQPTDLPGWYALGDCLVFPTHGDPNGLVVEEALAAGLPVIVSDAAGDIRSRVPEGVAGYVFPVGSADDLEERMRKVALGPALQIPAEFTATKSVEGYAADFESFVDDVMGHDRTSGLATWVCIALGHLAMLVSRLQRWRLAPYVHDRPPGGPRAQRARLVSPRRMTEIASAAYRRNHLARNSGWVIIATGVNGLLGLAFWAEATHAFSESTIGSASTVLAAMTFASTAALMGLGTTALQILPRADDKTWSTAVNSVISGGAVAGVLAGLVTATVLPHVSNDHAFTSFAEKPLVFLCVALGTSVLTIAEMFDYVFTAERRAHYVVIRGATFGVLKLAILSALILAGVRSGPWLIFIWVCGSLLTSASTVLWQIRHLGRPHRYSVNGVVQYIRKWFKILILHHMTSLGSIMIPSLMPVLVVSRLGSVDSAHFYVAWLLSSILLTVSSAVAGNLLADLSYDDEPMAQKLRRAARLIAALLLPPIVLVAALGRWVLGIFGSSYAAHSYGILLLFVIVAVPDAVTNVYVTVLRAKREPHKAAAMNVAMAVVALGGAWYLMGIMGVVGAAWAWALAQVVGCGYVAFDWHQSKRREPSALVSPGTTGGDTVGR